MAGRIPRRIRCKRSSTRSKNSANGATFRAENSNTSRHLAEFWMVEPEVAFYELTDNMDLAERFLKRLFKDALDQCGEDMALFNEHYDKTTIATLEKIVATEFRRLP